MHELHRFIQSRLAGFGDSRLLVVRLPETMAVSSLPKPNRNDCRERQHLCIVLWSPTFRPGV